MPEQTPTPPPRDNLRGILWMALFTLCMSAMHAAVRHVSGDLHPFEIAFFRLLFGFVIVLPWFIKLGWAPLKTRRFGLMSLRGVLNLTCMMAFFFALSITPLAEVTALMFSAPIFATVLAMAVFGERAGARRWTAIAFGFAGTLVVLQPGFGTIGLGPVLVLFAAFGWGICMVIIKSLGKTESSVTIITYMSLVMTPLSLIPALWVWQWPTDWQWVWLLVIGLLGGAGQMSMTEALRAAETHAVAPVDFLKLIWISVIAFLAFGEVPGPYTWIGGVMIFGATAFIAWREHVLRSAPLPRLETT